MSTWLTEEDRVAAIRILRGLPASVLRRAVDDEISRLVMTAERTHGLYRSSLPDGELPAFVVDSRGVDLLQGPRQGRDLRKSLADTLGDNDLERLYNYASEPSAWSRADRVERIADRNWHPGKSWARLFVAAVGLPGVFAGVVGLPGGPDCEDVEPYIPLPKLHDFQAELALRLLSLLEDRSHPGRGLLSLPTGAGKTRTVVDALLEWWAADDLDRGAILWIAQSDELCEQAVQAFRQAWVDRGWKHTERRPLKIHRLWSGRPVPDPPEGVVVASIQKLYSAVSRPSSTFSSNVTTLIDRTCVVIVDEAHHITAPGYLEVLNQLGIASGRRQDTRIPLIGLTATPYRGMGVDENRRLARFFAGNLLIPDGMPDPISELQAMGILAYADHESLETGRKFMLDARESEQVQHFQNLPDSFVRRVGTDALRNKLTIDRILVLPPHTPTLVFGCSIEQAISLSVLLRRRGRAAAAISAETRSATRRFVIEQFRKGQLEVLCNYGVLTTGFDAPLIEAVVIARPTMSPVLYEQMIGRGLRGPANGGSERCLIIDLVDNIAKFQGVMAYTRYSEYWPLPGPSRPDDFIASRIL